jgi:hypothetical protein
MADAGKRSIMMRRVTLMLLCSVGLWGCGTAGRYLGPTVHGYSFHASAVPSEIFLPSDVVSQENFPSTATLLVQVRDVNEQPVAGVPVTVQLVGSQCQGVITPSAQRVMTLQGRASITLTTANTTGICQIAVRVDNVTQELTVTVSSPPEPPGLR